MKKLDVGCGGFPSGDVNCDFVIEDLGHRTQKGRSINVKKIRNFVMCDVQYLPFRDNCFDIVFSSHVIEHVENPIMMLDEMFRVTNDEMTVKCPHWLGDKLQGKNPYHINYFRCRWFHQYCKKLKAFYRIRISLFRIGFIGLIFHIPLELTVNIRKLEK